MGRTRSSPPRGGRRSLRRKPATLEARVVQVTDHVSDLLVDLGVAPDRASEDGPFLVRYGSTVVMVRVFAYEDRSWVRIASVVLTGFRPSLELLVRILHLNTEVVTGAFLLFEDDTLSFAVTIPGEDLSPEAFQLALACVARVSDDVDEELQALAGGRRAADVLDTG